MSTPESTSVSSRASRLPVVMISMSRWDGDYSSAAWSLAKELSKAQPVLYADYPFTITDFFREWKTDHLRRRRPALLFSRKVIMPLPDFGPMLYALTPPLMLPVNRLADGLLYRKLKLRNDRLFARSIRNALRELGFDEFIFFNSFNPLYLTILPEGMNPRLYLYQSRDNLAALEPYLKKFGIRSELEAIRQADLSFATSKTLQRDLSEKSGTEVRLLPNAADFGMFSKSYTQKLPVPHDIRDIPAPRIGYTGNICHRLDYDIIRNLCETHPDKSVVMVGPRNHQGHTDIDLDAIPNLYFTGAKPISELPAYLAAFDALILPFRINDLTRSIYPLKLNEYLASGKPVISTPFSEDIHSFSDVVELPEHQDDFSRAVGKAIAENTDEKARARHERASENTWQKRAELLRSWIDKKASF